MIIGSLLISGAPGLQPELIGALRRNECRHHVPARNLHLRHRRDA
jgi:hypothetical protein